MAGSRLSKLNMVGIYFLRDVFTYGAGMAYWMVRQAEANYMCMWNELAIDLAYTGRLATDNPLLF